MPQICSLESALPALPWHLESPISVVSFERLGQADLIDFVDVFLTDGEHGKSPAQAVDEAVPHGIGGLEADVAVLRALAQR